MVFDGALNVAAPATLAEYTRAALVVPELRERDTAGIISELSQVLQREGTVVDVLPFYHTALNQELLSNSALEPGLAFPHARMSGVKHLRFALGRAPQPVSWGARNSCGVRFVFLLAVPATDAASYLQLLASLARLGRQADLLAELGSARDAEAMLGVLERIKMRQG
jgi:mannitol/fructose-specific phosphotransferase system IIA component (Ntr-type)